MRNDCYPHSSDNVRHPVSDQRLCKSPLLYTLQASNEIHMYMVPPTDHSLWLEKLNVLGVASIFNNGRVTEGWKVYCNGSTRFLGQTFAEYLLTRRRDMLAGGHSNIYTVFKNDIRH